eukprot:UN11917
MIGIRNIENWYNKNSPINNNSARQIYRLGVDKNYIKSGIGKSLMNTVEQHTEMLGYEYLVCNNRWTF